MQLESVSFKTSSALRGAVRPKPSKAARPRRPALEHGPRATTGHTTYLAVRKQLRFPHNRWEDLRNKHTLRIYAKKCSQRPEDWIWLMKKKG